MTKPVIVLDSVETYKESSIEYLKWKLKDFFEDPSKININAVKEAITELNEYENLEHLKPLSEEHVHILDEDKIDIRKAEEAVLKGEVFWEHAAAGEATRLGLGTKYLIYPNELTTEKIIELQRREIEKDYQDRPEKKKELLKKLTAEKIEEQMGCRPEELLPLNLGTRHILQLIFDIRKLARKYGKDPDETIKKQSMLIILNEKTEEQITKEWITNNYFGLDPENVFFMVQKSFHGIDIRDGEPFYDESHDSHKRLHNHGQMVMQKTHDDEIYYIIDEQKIYLKSYEFEDLLKQKKDLLSYSIEDITYLTGAIDWHSLALALELGEKGYGMVMEIVGQNPLKPQKGGAAFYDEKKGRPVIIESNQLKGIKNEDITHLNKNFNHYPNPAMAFKAVKEGILDLHTCIKEAVDNDGEKKHYLYFCTPQGDINFLVPTAYVMRKVLKPIANWKSPATTPPTIKACKEQDNQEGFKEFAKKTVRTLKEKRDNRSSVA